MRPKSKEPPITKAQRALWHELNTIIRECGGWTTSQPDTYPLRFECEMDSPLPAALQAISHTVRRLGSHERLMPQTIVETRGNRTVVNQQIAPGTVEVHELSILAKNIPA
jgi:hypothetical protein